MSEYILNLLPVTEAEKAEFEAIAPDAVHVYAGRRTLTSEQIAQATVILGWPRPKDIKGAARLKWFQTMWAGTDEYEGEGILPSGVIFTSPSGPTRQSVAEHILSFTLALCRRLPTYRDAQRDHRWEDHGAMKTIFGANVLVVGAGNIGATFAAMCRGLGAHTIGLKRTVNGPIAGFDEVFSIDHLDDLLPQADVVVLGPGSLYTSVIPNLLVDGIVDAIRDCNGLKVYVCNVMTQEGETEGYTVSDHIRAIFEHSSQGLFHLCLTNSSPIPKGVAARYAEEGAELLRCDKEACEALGVEVITRPVSTVENGLVRHNPGHLAWELVRLHAQRNIRLVEDSLRRTPRNRVEK